MGRITPGHLFGLAAVIAAVALLVLVLQQREGVAITPPATTAPPTAIILRSPDETPIGTFQGRPVYERDTPLTPEDHGWDLQINIIAVDGKTGELIPNAVIDIKIERTDGQTTMWEQPQGMTLGIRAGSIVSWRVHAEGYKEEEEWAGGRFVMKPSRIWRIEIKAEPLPPQT